MTDEKDRETLWVLAPLAVVAGTVLTFLIGFFRESAFYGRLGIPLRNLEFPIEHFLIQSFTLLIIPIGVFIMLAVLDVLRNVSKWEDLEAARPFQTLSPWASAFIAAVCSVVYALTQVGKNELSTIFLGRTLQGLIFGLLVLTAGAVLLVQLVGKKTPFHAMLGNSPTGSMFLVLFMVLFLGVGSELTGSTQASDQAWGCVGLPAIEFTPHPEGLDEDKTYWLILHNAGNYYVRNAHLPGNVTQYHIIAESSIQWATVSTLPAVRDC